jgi:monovalent cation:H+ antiporter-2, CPA2 family
LHESFLRDIALVLGVAAITSALARRFKLPTVLGYMIAGLIIGPYIPIPLFADAKRVESLSEFGVILVMFSVGLEFRLKRFFQVLPTAGITALLEMSMMFMLGLSIGYLFNWTTVQAIFLGGALSISSTMIVSKVFEENKPSKDIKDHVFGILVIQDIVAIILLAVLGTLAASNLLKFDDLMPSIVKLVSILVFSVIAGLFIIPKFVRSIAKLNSNEVLTIVATGICFALATLVEGMGYSVALGAFLAGILISESGESHKIEKLTRPLKDVFAAIFFVSIGMTVNLVVAYQYLPQALLVTVAVVLFQFITVFIGGVLSGTGSKKALYSSLTLGQIGEFAFIISAIGLSAGVVGPEFQAIIVTVGVLSSLCTPFLWKNSESIVRWILKKTPKSIRITIGLYEAWFDRLQEGQLLESKRLFGVPKKIIFAIVIDSVLLVVLPPLILKFLPILISSFSNEKLQIFKLSVVLVVLFMVMTPILYGLIKSFSHLITYLSEIVFRDLKNKSIEIEATKKLFSLTLWTLLIFIIGLPVISALSPFMNHFVFIFLFIVMISVSLGRLWRSASDITHDFESGGERIMSVIKRQTFEEKRQHPRITIPGLDNIEAISLSNKELFGQSLATINLRNKTGVTVVSILRGDEKILFPNHEEILQKDDVLHIWGSKESKTKCKKILIEE